VDHHGDVLPSDLNDDTNWDGGFYELALELEVGGDEELEQTLLAVWREALVSGCYAPEYRGSATSAKRRLVGHMPVDPGADALDRLGHLHGLVRLAGGIEIVCGAYAMRETDGHDWLSFYLPLGALVKADARARGYPFGPDKGPASLAWRQPIDDWLASVAIAVYPEIRFLLGLIGCEAAGEVNAAALAEEPGPPHLGYLLPVDRGLRYQPATT
jgi:hypothetical protein